MSRFYFDVREGSQLAPDGEGLDFDGVEAAEREAVLAAVEIGQDWLPRREGHEVTVEVRDEHGRGVTRVTVSMLVERT